MRSLSVTRRCGHNAPVSAEQVAKAVIAMAVAVAFALLAARPQVKRWEQRLGLTVLATSGFPFLVLGLTFRELGVLTEQLLIDLRPAFEFGLGWIGFLIGTHLDARRLERLPATFVPVLTVVSVVPVVFAAIACSLTLSIMGVLPGTGLIRDVLLLSACAAVSAPANLDLLLRGCGQGIRLLVVEITKLDQVAALAILGYVAIHFRPDQTLTMWNLPRSAWLLVMLGLGSLMGILAFALLRGARHRNEQLALLVGAVALAAGISGYLALSAALVGALAGAVLTNFPLPQRDEIVATLRTAERPLYFIFLFMVGAFWRPDEWQGWVLGLAFAVSRGYGKLLAARAVAAMRIPDLPSARALTLSLLPESAVAIVVIMSAAISTGAAPSAPVRWAINAVIVGSVLTEFVVQTSQRRERRRLGEETIA